MSAKNLTGTSSVLAFVLATSLLASASALSQAPNFAFADESNSNPVVQDDGDDQGEVSAATQVTAKLTGTTTFTYNGEAQVPEITLDGVAAGDDVTPVLEYVYAESSGSGGLPGWQIVLDEAPCDSGDYQVRVVGLAGNDAGKYALSSEATYKYSIEQKLVYATVGWDPYSFGDDPSEPVVEFYADKACTEPIEGTLGYEIWYYGEPNDGSEYGEDGCSEAAPVLPGKYQAFVVVGDQNYRNSGDDFAGYSEFITIERADANIAIGSVGSKTTADAPFELDVDHTTTADLTYKSSNENVATVDSEGMVTLVGEGEVTITVSAEQSANYEAGSDSVTFKVGAPNLSAAKVTLSSSSFTYNGKAQKPSVGSVVLGSSTLVAGTDYEVSAGSNKKVGTYKVSITGKGSYVGTTTATYTITPKSVTGLKLKKAKKSFKATWTKYSSERSGVQVRYSTKSSMSGAKTVKAAGASAKAKTVTKLKKKTKYYVQVRSYKVVNGKTYYSGWSAKKSVKTK